MDASGVSTVVKLWLGYGAARDGWDSHNYYGRYATFPGNNLAYHARPFTGAFAANVAGVMPTYSILEGATWRGKPVESVGAAFNRALLTDVLRGEFRFRGLIVTDWAISNDCTARCREGVGAGERPSFADVGMPWGVEDVPKRARFVKAVAAGVDQFGGTEEAAMIVDAVRAGELTETRLDASVQRVMALKFAQGLFENPYVDSELAARTVGTDAFRAAGLDAQRRALVLLENRGAILPLKKKSARVYLIGVDSNAARAAGLTVVSEPAQLPFELPSSMDAVAAQRSDVPYDSRAPLYRFGFGRRY